MRAQTGTMRTSRLCTISGYLALLGVALLGTVAAPAWAQQPEAGQADDPSPAVGWESLEPLGAIGDEYLEEWLEGNGGEPASIVVLPLDILLSGATDQEPDPLFDDSDAPDPFNIVNFYFSAVGSECNESAAWSCGPSVNGTKFRVSVKIYLNDWLPKNLDTIRICFRMDGGAEFCFRYDGDNGPWAFAPYQTRCIAVPPMNSYGPFELTGTVCNEWRTTVQLIDESTTVDSLTKTCAPWGVVGVGTVSNVQASDDAYCDKVRVTWNSASGATGYKVYRSTSNSQCPGSPIGTPAGTSFDDTTATPGTTYWYSVKGYNVCREGSCSSTDSGRRKSVPGPPSVSASDGTYCEKVRVTWGGAAGATGYRLYRSTSNSQCSGSPIYTGGATTYDDTSGNPGTTYWYSAKAYNECGDSSCSSTDSGYRKDVPGTVSGVSASDGTYCDKVQVQWNGVSGATGYKVYRSTSNSQCPGSPIGQPTGTTYDDTSATPGTTYWYSIKATNDCGDGGCSSTDSGYRKGVPGTVSGVSASDGEYCDKVRVTWGVVPGATYYKLYRSTTNTPCSGTLIGTVTATTYDDMSANPGTTYWYSVQACNECGCGPCSGTDSGWTGSRPGTPTGLSASDGIYCDKVRVTWNAVSGATGYKVYRSTSNSQCPASPIGTPTGTTYDDTSATPGTTYWYSVKATNACGDSDCSSTASGRRGNVPAAPSGLSASDGTYCDKVRVTWNAVSGATGYKVYRGTSNSQCPGSPIGTPTGTTYDDTSATPGTTYWYSVKATNACGDSDCSATDSGYRAAVPDIPTNVSASDGDHRDRVRVTWDAVSGANSYKIYRGTVNSSCPGSPIGTSNAPSFDDASVVPNTTYYYSVKAVNGCGESNCSNVDAGHADPGVVPTWCRDADGDGHGNPDNTKQSATQPAGYIAGPCDDCGGDNDKTVYPGAPELCDGKDNNCNGQIDEGVCPGACCIDKSCQQLTLEACEAAGGEYYGGSCTPNLCDDPPLPGACCIGDECQMLTAANCAAAGGEYLGGNCTGSRCVVDPPTGACCFDDGYCAKMTRVDCLAADGTYQGDNTRCTAGLCPDPPPERVRRWYRDADGDGYGYPAVRVDATQKPNGYVDNDDDCDDGDPYAYPGAPVRDCLVKDCSDPNYAQPASCGCGACGPLPFSAVPLTFLGLCAAKLRFAQRHRRSSAQPPRANHRG